jgi:hypothetical protein
MGHRVCKLVRDIGEWATIILRWCILIWLLDQMVGHVVWECIDYSTRDKLAIGNFSVVLTTLFLRD